MKYEINGCLYTVRIIKKGNKNTYIRAVKDQVIEVSTNYLVSEKSIFKILDKNKDGLLKMIEHQKYVQDYDEAFYFMGKKYDIIFRDDINGVVIDNEYIYATNIAILNRWYADEIRSIFKKRLDCCYQLFEESIPYPTLKIRKMRSRWGVCNRRFMTITLNSNLMRFQTAEIDYVIIHELAHFVCFNHSTAFWEVVSKYCPKYKDIKKVMKE